MSMLVDFSIFPIDKGESLTPYVAKALSIIKKPFSIVSLHGYLRHFAIFSYFRI